MGMGNRGECGVSSKIKRDWSEESITAVVVMGRAEDKSRKNILDVEVVERGQWERGRVGVMSGCSDRIPDNSTLAFSVRFA